MGGECWVMPLLWDEPSVRAFSGRFSVASASYAEAPLLHLLQCLKAARGCWHY